MATNSSNTSADDPEPQVGSFVPGADQDAAADLIRSKVSRIYSEEPAPEQELAQSNSSQIRSKHQEFMYKLGTSGKDLATIQTEWHDYYQKLPAKEKHQVWQEFYSSPPLLTS